jgi:hypothetical protein
VVRMEEWIGQRTFSWYRRQTSSSDSRSGLPRPCRMNSLVSDAVHQKICSTGSRR